MAEKKKSVSQEEVKAAIEKTESVPMEELRYKPEPENANQRMDVFPELLAKVRPEMVQKSIIPTYGMVLPREACQNRVCKLNVAKILAMQEARKEMERQQRRRRYEILDTLKTAAVILFSVGFTAVCVAAVAYLGQFL